ncbi:MAG: prepilin-type N-terminal cleavage/methylation domain-containing protein [Candidatus Omnitrophica bacterium]|nr:prepilin-type N-terminal cleavage/methylation domain-containing protein [Candidatus Omnitrophota bacterium]
MHRKEGFTLLEILVVIIIIGILATLALPQYMKTIKKARVAEASSNIGSLRGALLRYYQEYGTFPPDASTSVLDIEDPNTRPGAYFSYTYSGSSPDNLVIKATGQRSPVIGIVVTYDSSTGKLDITGF